MLARLTEELSAGVPGKLAEGVTATRSPAVCCHVLQESTGKATSELEYKAPSFYSVLLMPSDGKLNLVPLG